MSDGGGCGRGAAGGGGQGRVSGHLLLQLCLLGLLCHEVPQGDHRRDRQLGGTPDEVR